MFRLFFGPKELFLIEHAADADLLWGERDDPEPFIVQTNNDRVAGLLPRVECHTCKMAENRELFQGWIDLAQTFLVTGEIAPATGVDQEGPFDDMSFPVWI